MQLCSFRLCDISTEINLHMTLSSEKFGTITWYRGGKECLTYNKKEGRPSGLVTLHRNCLLKHVFEGNIEGRIKITER